MYRRMTSTRCLARSGYYAQEWALLYYRIPLREALEEIAAGVFEDTGLYDEHAGDICLYYIHYVISF